MIKYFLLSGALFFNGAIALASPECEIVDALKIVKEIVCEKSIGSIYHPNGTLAGSKGNNWYYQDSKFAGSVSGNWYYSNGNSAGVIGGRWYHPNGTFAGTNNSSWYYSNGVFAGTNGGSWYDRNSNFLGNFSNLTEIEQLRMVLE